MVAYSKANVKLPDAKLEKLKTAVKNKTGMTLRMSLKMFDGNHLTDELLLTTRKRKKLINAFNNNMSTDLKLSKAQISKTNSIWRVFSIIIKCVSESSCSFGKKYFSTVRNDSSCFSD